MNPLYKALTGGFNPMQTPTVSASPMIPNAGMNGIWGRVQQISSMMRNPQQLVQQYIPDAPAEIRNDPDQIVNWLQQSGRVNPQMVQMARQMMGR